MTPDEFESLNFTDKCAYIASVFDQFDFEPFIKRCSTVQDLISDIREFCYENEPDLFQGELWDGDPFFYWAADEFADYLNKRYKDKYWFAEPEFYEPPIYIHKKG